MAEEIIELCDIKYKGLNVVHLNIRSIIYKIDQIKMIISQAKIDILCLTESRLNPIVTDHELKTDLGTLKSCWIQLNMKYTITILLGLLYKPPKSPVGQTIRILTELLAKIQPKYNTT